MTSARKRQIAAFQRAGAKARRSWSSPKAKKARQIRAYYKGELSYTPPGLGGRRDKMGGKAYAHKAGSRLTIAPGAQQILNGEKVTNPITDFHPSTVRGDMVQAGGQLTRKHRKSKSKSKK